MNAGGPAVLWLAVVAFGIYHGLNPAMGWPLAVANGLSARRDGAVFATFAPLAAGHLMAMAIVVLPFALLGAVFQHERAIRIGAGVLVLAFGTWRLVEPRHPRYLARIAPTRLAWWSFVMATAHGAALMLLPLALGLCATGPGGASADAGHVAIDVLARSNAVTAIGVTLLHTGSMLVSGVAIAWLVYRVLGLGFLRRAWLNLDTVWGASLVLSGAVSVALALWR
ncbi:MAG: hypothetical protein ABIV63_08255 [Caldimonas sp.]